MSGSEYYDHSGTQRPNNPTAEMATTSHHEKRRPGRHRTDVKESDRSSIPTLAWKRKRETKTVAAPLLSTVEKIDPAAWVETLRSGSEEPDMFASFDLYENPGRAKWEWYEHYGNWQNRLIHADAKRAMASLLEHEQMAGQIQCVYFDPPYGMDFDARYMDDTIQVTAFRDSYESGIHSYLDGIRETAMLARELLSETGSFFMQIGDVNVHRCAMVLDEVFGPENRVSTIMYATGGGGSSSKSISKAGDFILWYAKEFSAPMFFQALYEEQDIEDWCDSQTFAGGGGDFPDNTSRPLQAHERRDPKNNIPEGTELWRMGRLLSQGPSEGEQGKPFIHEGVQYGPDGLQNSQWRVDRAGLEHLAAKGRLWSNVKAGTGTASANQLHLKVYRREMPGKRLTNHWAASISPNDKRYAVQTGNLAIERCMLMTTKPGDLVLDPTGGSGTTALVAEQWGRRWISIDSSRESIAVTRERVLVHSYPRYMLIGSKDGFEEEQKRRKQAGQEPLKAAPAGGEKNPSTGFVVKRIPYVSAATLAYEDRPDKRSKREITWLADRPAGKKSGRVCSRFTVETELLEIYRSPDEMVRPAQARRDVNWQERIISMLDEKGVRSDSGQHWDLEGVQSIVDKESNGHFPGLLSHTATLLDRRSGRKVPAVIAIWPEDAKVDETAIHRNVRETLRRTETQSEVLIVIGAEFADGTEPGRKGHRWSVEVMRVNAGTDLHLSEVTDQANTTSLVLVAEPAVSVDRITGEDTFECTVHGWNEFNPVTGTARWREQKNIRMWMLDTDYDGTQFCARRIHIPRQRGKEYRKILDQLLGRDGHPEALKAAFGWKSHPFTAPAHGEVAVRVVTVGGGMMSWCGRVTTGRSCKRGTARRKPYCPPPPIRLSS